MATIEILTADGCSKCKKAKDSIMNVMKEFDDKVEYKEVNITREPARLVGAWTNS